MPQFPICKWGSHTHIEGVLGGTKEARVNVFIRSLQGVSWALGWGQQMAQQAELTRPNPHEANQMLTQGQR